ncbi:MAG: UDP-N-acetylmuramate dehydrogenase [Patescibacteria group bacterium]
MTIQENILLKEHTTFHIGGAATYFVEVSTIDELQKAVSFAKEKKLKIFILGGGSNVLVSDSGFEGLVIKIVIKGRELKELGEGKVEVVAGAGEEWDAFVGFVVDQNLFGLENLSYIPGSVGATPVQNIGAYGSEVKDTISWVEVFNSESNELEKFTNEQCKFAYRDSYFKKSEGKKYIIIRVAFLLSRNGKLSTDYKDVKDYIATNNIFDLTLQKVREIITAIRIKKLPDVKLIGTAGSFFKNPIVPIQHYKDLLELYPTMPHYVLDTETVKVPAAWILDNLCGFKGYRDGEVGVYQNQALVLVNFGGGNADQVAELAEKMIACVKEKTKIVLEKEVQYI